MEIIRGSDIPVETKRQLSYEYDDNYFTISETRNGKTREIYHIPRKRCKTIEQQLDWVLQVAGKNWSDAYEFKDEFAATIRLWKYNSMDINKEKK